MIFPPFKFDVLFTFLIFEGLSSRIQVTENSRPYFLNFEYIIIERIIIIQTKADIMYSKHKTTLVNKLICSIIKQISELIAPYKKINQTAKPTSISTIFVIIHYLFCNFKFGHFYTSFSFFSILYHKISKTSKCDKKRAA